VTDRVRLVQVAGSAQWAGGEVFLKQMAERLDRARFDLRVICPEEGPLVEEMRRRDVPCAVVPLSPLGDPRPVRRLRERLADWRADIVQSHGARSNFYTRFAAAVLPHAAKLGLRLAALPNISTIHNALSDYPVFFLRKKLYAWMDALSAPRATRVVCVAEALRREFLARVPGITEKTSVIHNGVDLERFNPDAQDPRARRSLGVTQDVWTVGIVGRLTEQKGHAYLLQALDAAKKELPPFVLLIAGDGPLRPALEAKAKALGLGDACRFLGVRDDVPAVYSAADVVALPSLSEGFPYAALEAMAMGKPVVATRVNGVPELMMDGTNGLLVPPRDSGALARALARLGRDKDLAKRLGDSARAHVRNSFDAKDAVRKWENLYMDVMNDVRHRRLS